MTRRTFRPGQIVRVLVGSDAGWVGRVATIRDHVPDFPGDRPVTTIEVRGDWAPEHPESRPHSGLYGPGDLDPLEEGKA